MRTYHWRTDMALTAAEEIELTDSMDAGIAAAAARQGLWAADATDAELAHLESCGQRARTEFLERNIGLVLYFANRAAPRFRGSTDELVQEGFIGLVRAADRFDGRAGVRFSTYATPWVRAAIEATIMREDGLGATIERARRRIHRAMDHLEQELDRRPTPDEIAHRMGQSREWVDEVLGRAAPVSLDQVVAVVPAPDVGEHESVAEWLEILRPLEREVIVRRFGLAGHHSANHAQVARDLGLSRESVRLVEERALTRMRSAVLPHATGERFAA